MSGILDKRRGGAGHGAPSSKCTLWVRHVVAANTIDQKNPWWETPGIQAEICGRAWRPSAGESSSHPIDPRGRSAYVCFHRTRAASKSELLRGGQATREQAVQKLIHSVIHSFSQSVLHYLFERYSSRLDPGFS